MDGPFLAAEEIPFGRPIRLVEGAWRLAGLADMEGVAGRPRWANRTRENNLTVFRSAFLPGEPVEPVITDGQLLMVFPEKHMAGGFVTLPGDSGYVTVRGGRLVE